MKTAVTIQDFFDDYAAALEQFNAKKISAQYALPCLMISDDKTSAFTDATTLESLFVNGFSFLKQHGMVHARPDVLSRRQWTPLITKARVQWSYFGADKQPLYSCDYSYVLHQQKDTWKIEVAVSVNEKERLEEWLDRDS